MVVGLTTAATLWYVTVLGLCFGSGQIWLGLTGLVLGLAAIWGLRFVEPLLPRERQACLTIRYDRGRIGEEALLLEAVRAPYVLMRSNSSLSPLMGTGEIRLYLRWRSTGPQNRPPEMVDLLARRDGVQHVSWDPAGVPADW
jgi:putative Mg2+ transporter-C (MgtC) family protein